MKIKIMIIMAFLLFQNLFFAKEMKIAVLSNSGSQLYVRANNEIEVFSNGMLLDKKREVKFSAGKNSVTYEGKSYSDIVLKPENKGDFLYISKSGKNFDGYRGNFGLIIENGRIVPVNLIDMDEYLYSVVPSEIGKKFPDEAVKAQIVTSRTYSYYNAKNSKFKNYDMVDNVNSQVYKGIAAEDEKINKLVDSTKNIVMTYKGEPINAIFHDDSGGYTANVEDVWGGTGLEYLKAVDDSENVMDSPRRYWSYTITKDRLSKIFGVYPQSIEVEKKDNRIKKVLLKGSGKTVEVTGNEFRKRMGYTNIFSTVFDYSDNGGSFIFSGHGSGHGVGLPQWGAYAQAEKNKKYDQILKYYFTGIKIEEIRDAGF
jgi:stage II sporulation protein D